MRILQIHNTYRQAGGEDSVVATERDLLESHGNEVRLFGADNSVINGPIKKLSTALRVTYNVEVRRRLEGELKSWRPDVVHVHNFFPLLTPSVFDACRNSKVPVVMTLHNFRLLCPGALLWRHGEVCELCLKSRPLPGILHRCYRDSFLGSLSVARMVDYHLRRRTWATKVDRYIVMTEFSRQKFISAGWEPGRISVKPHSCRPSTVFAPENTERQGALFAGRLSLEKGVSTLLAAWRHIPHPLRLAGDGYMRGEINKENNRNIHMLGWLSSQELSKWMSQVVCLVVPSECYETFGMVILEAYAHGIPVIAPRIGALEELVEEGKTGFLFTPGDSVELAAKVNYLLERPDDAKRMGENARSVYFRDFTPERNYTQLVHIYQEMLNGE